MAATYIPSYPNNENNILEIDPIEKVYTYDTNLDTVLGTQPLIDNGKLKTQNYFVDKTLFASIMGINSECRIDCSGYNTIAIQVVGSWSTYLIVEGSVDGGNFTSMSIINSQYASTSNIGTGYIIGNNIYRTSVAGFKIIRVRFITYATGSAQITMTCSMQPFVLPLGTTTSGLYLSTYDTTLAGNNRAGFGSQEQIVAPTVNPSLPASYTANNFAKYPQTRDRIRVEIGGDKKLPLAQEQDTNRLLISNPEELSMLEKIYLQVSMQTQILASINNFSLPNGWEEIR